MKKTVAALGLIVSASSAAPGQSLEGVWKPIVVVVDSGPNQGRHTTDVQPGLLIVTRHHYSVTLVQGFKPRPIPRDSATNEELGLSFLPFTANAGTYTRTGSEITLSPIVAKNPAVMAGKPLTSGLRVKGDTMWVKAVGRGGSATTTWVRIERR
jgi:hypothetical protein